MKASKTSIAGSVDKPEQRIRFYLLYGPDNAQSRALAARLADSLGASRFLVAGGSVKADPASLADEAGAMNLFGGKRLIWIEPATDEVADGVRALLDLHAAESPVVAVAGALTKASALVKLAEAAPDALAFASYAPEGQHAERLVVELGRRVGLKIAPHIARRIAASCGNDQAVIAQELEKFALYLDASPHTPRELDSAAVEAVGADSSEGNFLRLADLALSGSITELAVELTRLSSGAEAIPVVRSLQRRILLLAPARARVERGERVDAVMASLTKALFWRDKTLITSLIGKWTAADLAKVAERASSLERELMFSNVPDREALGEELLAIARKARSSR
ncbi:MAG: DNA polymerase III subunit delta [Sphingomicrobium sp.]